MRFDIHHYFRQHHNTGKSTASLFVTSISRHFPTPASMSCPETYFHCDRFCARRTTSFGIPDSFVLLSVDCTGGDVTDLMEASCNPELGLPRLGRQRIFENNVQSRYSSVVLLFLSWIHATVAFPGYNPKIILLAIFGGRHLWDLVWHPCRSTAGRPFATESPRA